MHMDYSDGLVQERRNSIVDALELHLFCIYLSVCALFYLYHHFLWIRVIY